MSRTPLRDTCLLLLLAGAVGTVHAVTFTATLEPIRLTAVPGTAATRTFRLHLPEDQPTTRFQASIEDFWRSEDGGRSFYRPAGTIAPSCGPWIELDPVESTVTAGGDLAIRLTVATPADAAPGGYWCALTVDQLPGLPTGEPDGGPRLEFLASVSVAVYVTVEPVHRSARIGAVDLAGDECELLLVNDGDTPLSAEGTVTFIRADGTVAADLVVPRNLVLPEPFPRTRLRASLPPADVLPSGHYLVEVLVDIGLDHFIGVRNEVDVVRGASATSPAS